MEDIISFEIRVTNNDNKTFIEKTFIIDKDYSKLIFDVSYSPKYLEDKKLCLDMMKQELIRASYDINNYDKEVLLTHVPLKNHISWIIYNPFEQLGTKHKHDKHQILFISESESSDGFKKSKIHKGEWKIKAGLTAILTDYVDIFIKVRGEI